MKNTRVQSKEQQSASIILWAFSKEMSRTIPRWSFLLLFAPSQNYNDQWYGKLLRERETCKVFNQVGLCPQSVAEAELR